MLWLQKPAWARNVFAALILLVAIFVEFRPDSRVDRPFLTTDIAAGEEIGAWNTELRRVPSGLIEPVARAGIAVAPAAAGEPLLPSMVGSHDDLVPSGWWSLDLELPEGARRGDAVRILILETSQHVEGVVTRQPTGDGFGSPRGSVALDPDAAIIAAAAAASGQIAVMVRAR